MTDIEELLEKENQRLIDAKIILCNSAITVINDFVGHDLNGLERMAGEVKRLMVYTQQFLESGRNLSMNDVRYEVNDFLDKIEDVFHEINYHLSSIRQESNTIEAEERLYNKIKITMMNSDSGLVVED